MLTRLIVAATLCSLGCAGHAMDPNSQAAMALDTKTGRQYLSDRLLEICQREDGHLNYIRVTTRAAGKGVAMYCVHELYNQYSLSVGSRAPALSRWVYENSELLQKHKVTRVGVWGAGPSASGTWYNVAP